MNLDTTFQQVPPLGYFIIGLWTFFWKGLALYRSAAYKQKNWFVILFALMIVNTFGIADIIFLFAFAKTKMKISELEFWKKKRK